MRVNSTIELSGTAQPTSKYAVDDIVYARVTSPEVWDKTYYPARVVCVEDEATYSLFFAEQNITEEVGVHAVCSARVLVVVVVVAPFLLALD